MKKKGTHKIGKKVVIGAAALALAGTSFLAVSFGKNKPIQSPSYSVKSVTDGDSLFLTNGLEIRLANIDAPEKEMCGGLDAKKGLEKLVIGKPIYLFITAEDKYHRLVSMVYTDDHFVNAEMLRLGHATYPSSTAGYTTDLRKAIGEARTKGIGIHGPTCTQKINAKNPKCLIKGNNNDGNKYYYTKDCGFYDQAFVQLFLGDQWFCSEKEAQVAGYKKALRCG